MQLRIKKCMNKKIDYTNRKISELYLRIIEEL